MCGPTQGMYHFSPPYKLPRQETPGYGYKAGKSDTPMRAHSYFLDESIHFAD
jgi:hypothetical protein